MKSTLTSFQAGVDQLLVFLEKNRLEHEFIALLNEPLRRDNLVLQELHLLEKIIEAATNTKQYIYIVSIVSTYGLLERLVDGFISKYVNSLKNFSATFSGIPEVIKKNHLNLSISFADALLKDKFRHESSVDQVISNLHLCLSNSTQYELNGTAYALHKGNINLGRVSEMLTNLGLSDHLKMALRIPSFIDFLNANNLSTKINDCGDDEVKLIFEPINDLVARRNEVSHGVIDDVESIELLAQRAYFVKAYGEVLYALLENHALKHAAEVGAARNIGRPISVYDNRIVCFESALELSEGDTLFALTGDALEPIRHSPIVSIEVNKVPVKKITQKTKFGVCVNFHANPNHSFYWLPNK